MSRKLCLVRIPRIIIIPGTNSPHIFWHYNFFHCRHGVKHIVAYYVILGEFIGQVITVSAFHYSSVFHIQCFQRTSHGAYYLDVATVNRSVHGEFCQRIQFFVADHAGQCSGFCQCDFFGLQATNAYKQHAYTCVEMFL